VTASSEDAATIADLVRRSFAETAERFNLTPENAPTHPSNCRAEWITNALDKGIIYYLVKLEQTPCGCAAMEQANPEVCYLEKLAVLPEFRHNGLGAQLVEHVRIQCGKLGAKRIEIGIIEKDIRLKDWYLLQGFKEKNTAQFEHLPFSVLFMQLELE